jgi:sortase A
MPGQGGNAAIAGHRTTYGHPFYNLDGVKVGDPIVVTTLQGIFVYNTTKSFVVSPSDTSVINNVFANYLTLTTCNPRFSASTRLIVQAKLAHSQLFPNKGLPTLKLHSDPTSGDLAGDSSVQLTQTLFWGALFLVVGGGVLYAAWRFRRQADLRGRYGRPPRPPLVLLRRYQPAAAGQFLTARAGRAATARPLPRLRRHRRA